MVFQPGMPDDFKGNGTWGPKYFWNMVVDLWNEAERITAETVTVTQAEADELRAWANE